MMMLRNSSNGVVPAVGTNDRLAADVTFPRWSMPSPHSTPKRKMRELVSLPAPLRAPRLFKSLRNAQRVKQETKLERAAIQNLTQFLTTACPTDVLPKILAYAGPNAAAALQQTSRHFLELLNAEGTWRGLCEELYKVRNTNPGPRRTIFF